MSASTRSSVRRGAAMAAALVALVLLTAGGVAHRWLLMRIGAALGQRMAPLAPLATVPLEMAGWRGEDTPLDERVLRVVQFDDEYIQRRYVSAALGRSVGMFVGYVGRPRVHLGHRPDVCFAAHGMKPVATEPLLLGGAAGGAEAVLYEFRTEGLVEQRVFVLALYVINGRFSADPDSFRRHNARGAGLFGERRAYLARVQLSLNATGDRDADIAALRDLAEPLVSELRSVLPHLGDGDPAP